MTRQPTDEQLAALPEWATTYQVADVFSVDASTVARWCRDKWVEARQIRNPGSAWGMWQIRSASLVGWMPPRPGQYDRSQLS